MTTTMQSPMSETLRPNGTDGYEPLRHCADCGASFVGHSLRKRCAPCRVAQTRGLQLAYQRSATARRVARQKEPPPGGPARAESTP
jgi:hypothetical protein